MCTHQVDVELEDGAWGLGSPSKMIGEIALDTPPVDCYGPAGVG